MKKADGTDTSDFNFDLLFGSDLTHRLHTGKIWKVGDPGPLERMRRTWESWYKAQTQPTAEVDAKTNAAQTQDENQGEASQEIEPTQEEACEENESCDGTPQGSVG